MWNTVVPPLAPRKKKVSPPPSAPCPSSPGARGSCCRAYFDSPFFIPARKLGAQNGEENWAVRILCMFFDARGYIAKKVPPAFTRRASHVYENNGSGDDDDKKVFIYLSFFFLFSLPPPAPRPPPCVDA